MKRQILLAVITALGLSACASVPEGSSKNSICATDQAPKEALVCQVSPEVSQPDSWKKSNDRFGGPRGR